MASRFHKDTLKIVVAQLCQNIGFQGILSSSVDVLIDLLHRYLKDITISTHRYTEHYGRTVPTVDDLDLALQEMGISVKELEEYVNNVEPVSFPHKVPKLPIPRPLNLNFLKPGAREILSRPLHIHEHLPPMYPEKEEEENISNIINGENIKEEDVGDAQGSSQEKRSIEEDQSVNKKLKICNEEEGEPVREIDSVMMTTSGYISSAREGKMPDARRPLIPMSLSGGTSGVTKGPSSMTKKKATMEKIIRHKKHQGGMLASSSSKSKVKLKPKIPLAPPGTGSLAARSPGTGSLAARSPGSSQAPKLKIPNMNKVKEESPIKKPSFEKEGGERRKKDRREGKERRKRDRMEGGSKKKKDGHREYKYHFPLNRKERTRIRMRGLSKEEELRRYKERENELLDALAQSQSVTVTTIPAPSLRVREKTPEASPPEGSSKNKLSIFRKFPKIGSKDGGGDSSPDLMIDAPIVKEEKLSPPPSPNMDIPNMQDDFRASLPPTPKTPEMRHPYHMMGEESPVISPHKIKKEKNPEKHSTKKKSPRGRKRKGSTSSACPSSRGPHDYMNVTRSDTSDGNLSGTGDIPEGSPVFPLAPFSHGGPSFIPPFIKNSIQTFGAPMLMPLPAMDPMSHMYMESTSHHIDKGVDNFEVDDRPPTPKESIMRNISPVNPHILAHFEARTPVAVKAPLSPPPKETIPETSIQPQLKLSKSVQETTQPQLKLSKSTQEAIQPQLKLSKSIPETIQPQLKFSKIEKEKKKEHKKEKKEKEKERIKKKKEKKDKEKKDKEEKKKEKKEEKERLKSERKEKKKSSSSTAESVPKITLKFPSEAEENRQRPPSEPKVMPKLVIRPVLKHPVDEPTTVQPVKKSKKKKGTPPPSSLPPPRNPSPSPIPSLPSSTISLSFSASNRSSVKITHQEPPGSPPEIAKFSALVTRPPKGSQTKKSEKLSVPPLKIKDSGYKISSKKELSGSIKIEKKETTVPPLKIKNSSSLTISSSSLEFPEEKKSFHSKKSEKKEKKKNAPIIISSLQNIDTGGGVSVCPPPPPPQAPPVPSHQLPPPILLPSEGSSSKSSKKPTAGVSSPAATPGPQTKSVSKSTGLLTETVGPIGHFMDDQGNEVWICPTCGKQDDGTPMIGCDTCDDWYHWVCVGINVPPSEVENWYCPRCLSQHKQQRGSLGVEKKKRGRKRKII